MITFLTKSIFGGLAVRAVTFMLVRVMGAIATLGYTIMLARVTSAENVGILLSAISLSMIVSLLLSLNLEAGSIRYFALYSQDRRLNDLAGFVSLCRLVIFVILVPTTLLVATILWVKSTTVENLVMILIMTSLVSPFIALTRVNLRHATAMDVTLKAMIPASLIRPSTFALLILFALLLNVDFSRVFLALFFLLATLFSWMIQSFLIAQDFQFLAGTKARREDWREWLGLGLATSPGVLTGEYLKNLAVLAAALVLVPAEVAVFGIAISLFGLVDFGVKAVDVAVSPHLAKSIPKEDSKSIARLLGSTAAIKITAHALGCLFYYVSLDTLIYVMGSEFEGVRPILLPLLCIPFARAIFGPGQLILNITGHKTPSLMVSSLGAVAIALGTLAGGFIFGTIGAATGMSLAFLGYQITWLLVCRSKTGINPSIINIFRIFK